MWFSSCWSGYVFGLQDAAASCKPADQQLEKPQHELPQAATTV